MMFIFITMEFLDGVSYAGEYDAHFKHHSDPNHAYFRSISC